jgi:hypothetical protein
MLLSSIQLDSQPALKLPRATKITDLSTEELSVFNFLCLIVDIRYRQRYGELIEYSSGRGYNKNVQSDKVLADQLPSVDDGLLGHNRREVSGSEQ